MNLSTAALTAILVFGFSAGPSCIAKEQSSESKPVDQVEVTKVTGTVEKVNPDKRVMAIKLDNGKKKTLKVDKSVKDLDQFHAGDRVQVSYTEEIVMMAEPSDEGTAELANYRVADVVPEGEKPALVQADTSEVTGKIASVDPKKRRLTLEDPDGRKRSLKLGHKIKDLDRFKPGETINMAIKDEMAI